MFYVRLLPAPNPQSTKSNMSNSYFTELVATVAAQLQTLPDKPEEDAPATVRALWHKAAGRALSAGKAVLQELPQLDLQGMSALQTLIRNRLSGTPLAYLTGRQQFMNTELLVNPGALIPRNETELLGYTALNILEDIAKRSTEKPPLVIDLCTGSGNLACALSVHAPDLRVFGTDICKNALKSALDNQRFLGLDDRVAFFAGDMLEAFCPKACSQHVSMIVCNPPYISSTKIDKLPKEIIGHEPREAFDGGPLGVSILNRLVKEGANYIANGGWICCEVGQGQGSWLSKRLERTKTFKQVRSFCDANGNIRVVAAQRN